MLLLLVAATVVAFAMGETIEAVAILVVIVLNAVIGFLTEWRAEQALTALQKQAVAVAQVIRDGAGARDPRGRAGARGRRRPRRRRAGARRRPGRRGRAAAGRGGGADGRVARRSPRPPTRSPTRPRRSATGRHGLHGHDDHRRPRPADRHGHRHADRGGQDRHPDRGGRRPGTPRWSGSSPSSARPWSVSCWRSARVIVAGGLAAGPRLPAPCWRSASRWPSPRCPRACPPWRP